MARSVTFVLMGEPVAWDRAVPLGRAYVWDSQKHYKLIVSLAMEKVINGQALLSGPLEAQFLFYFPIPVRTSQRRKIEMANSLMINRPDFDNCAKILSDCGNGILYNDDKQIASAAIHKRYDDGNGPRSVMIVTEV